MRFTTVVAIVAVIATLFFLFALIQAQLRPATTSTTVQTPINTPSGMNPQTLKPSAEGQTHGWLIEVRRYGIESLTNRTTKITDEKYYYWNGVLYKYDNGTYWKIGKVDTIVIKNFTKSEHTIGGYIVTQVTFLPYNSGPPPTNDTVVKAHFQALYMRDRAYGYNITIETLYSQLLAALDAICREPGNKVITLPFANVTVDYRIISITKTNMLYSEISAMTNVHGTCAINPKAVKIEKT